jgi:hypothetical protein
MEGVAAIVLESVTRRGVLSDVFPRGAAGPMLPVVDQAKMLTRTIAIVKIPDLQLCTRGTRPTRVRRRECRGLGPAPMVTLNLDRISITRTACQIPFTLQQLSQSPAAAMSAGSGFRRDSVVPFHSDSDTTSVEARIFHNTSLLVATGGFRFRSGTQLQILRF